MTKAAEAYLIETAKAEGIQIGEAKMIKMMRDNGHSVEEISRITKLPIKYYFNC